MEEATRIICRPTYYISAVGSNVFVHSHRRVFVVQFFPPLHLTDFLVPLTSTNVVDSQTNIH